MFKDLTLEEIEDYEQWARDEFMPDVEPNPLWHPVIRTEWARLQTEHDNLTNA